MTSEFLTRIIEAKKAEIAVSRKRISALSLRSEAENRKKTRPFIRPFEKAPAEKINIIAEIKRASPSRGDIRPDLDPAAWARSYEKGGAVAVSVLTDTRFFKGSLSDLQLARAATGLPVLRKDFLISTYQIYESCAAGADAVLLIVRILSPAQLRDYLSLCRELGLDALVEIHSEPDLEAASKAGARLIGINNRDLGSFRTDIATAPLLARQLDAEQIPVAASGIRDRSDIDRNLGAGIRNFLIGESLVRAADPTGRLKALTHPET